MESEQDQLEIRFRLLDGSDIGPTRYPSSTSILMLKQTILSQWPKEIENGPRTVKDVKLISFGRILENNTSLKECWSPVCGIPEGLTTMHVVVQPPRPDKEKQLAKEKKLNKCMCVIL